MYLQHTVKILSSLSVYNRNRFKQQCTTTERMIHMSNRMPISDFASALRAALQRKDGYIMGATGQDPKKWAENSWWFTQYSGAQKTKALSWRKNAAQVWDCNGLAEGIYKDFSGVDINTKARYNYAQWCDPKGKGMIPAQYRVPGAAVFWGTSSGNIHHVAYLDRPVDPSNPAGDWYLIEARGVMYGVVQTKLNSRKPDFWGLMTKYFDYDGTGNTANTDGSGSVSTSSPLLGNRILKNGHEGEDVKQMQTNLIRLGYTCGSCGADGDFGDATELALRAFQKDHPPLEVDGEFGPKSLAALEAEISKLDKTVENPRNVVIVGGQCWARKAPTTEAERIGVAKEGNTYKFGGVISDEGWLLIEFDNQNAWVSGKYGKLVESVE